MTVVHTSRSNYDECSDRVKQALEFAIEVVYSQQEICVVIGHVKESHIISDSRTEKQGLVGPTEFGSSVKMFLFDKDYSYDWLRRAPRKLKVNNNVGIRMDE